MTRVSKGVGRHIDTKSSVRHARPVNERHTGRNIGRQDGTPLALSAGDFWCATTSLKARVLSCMTLAAMHDRKRITTIEGLERRASIFERRLSNMTGIVSAGVHRPRHGSLFEAHFAKSQAAFRVTLLSGVVSTVQQECRSRAQVTEPR
jgi:hypothetical protein